MTPSKRSGITAAGTWIVDYTKAVSQFPQEGACTSVLDESINNGGAPYNLLVDLCRLGAPFPLHAIGCLGQDIDGANILKDCKAHGIETSQLSVVPGASTSFSDVMTSSETGVRTSFNHAGANALLNENDFDFRKDTSRIFYLGTLFFLSALDARHARHGTKAAAVLASARKQGLLTCIDIERTNPAPRRFETEARAALHETDLAIFNVEVAELLTGVRMRYAAGIEMSAVHEAAEKLLEFSGGVCAVIRSPSGALALSKNGLKAMEGSVRIPSFKIQSATGSGHAFAAGFLYQYHESAPLSECLKAGHAAAASCLLDSTTSGGIKRLASCLELMKKFGQRDADHSTINHYEAA